MWFAEMLNLNGFTSLQQGSRYRWDDKNTFQVVRTGKKKKPKKKTNILMDFHREHYMTKSQRNAWTAEVTNGASRS